MIQDLTPIFGERDDHHGAIAIGGVYQWPCESSATLGPGRSQGQHRHIGELTAHLPLICKVSRFFSARSVLCYISGGNTAKDRGSVNITKKGSTPYDVFIKGGTIYDGSRAPGVRGDVGISGGKIAAVGKITDRSTTACWHGMTTVATGNCELAV